MNSTETKTELPITNNGSESEPLSLSTITMSKLSMENNTLRTRLEAAEKSNEELVAALKTALGVIEECDPDTVRFYCPAIRKVLAAEALKGEG